MGPGEGRILEETMIKLSLTAITFAFSEIQLTCNKNILNKMVSDIMNAAISRKYRSITFSDGITSRTNYENLIVQIHNFIIENDIRNQKFIMFHADDINSAKMFKPLLRKIECDSVWK